MTNRVAIFVSFIQCLSLPVMVMISLMNTSIYASVAVMFTARRSAFSRLSTNGCSSSFGSKGMCGEFRSPLSQDLSQSRSFPRFIVASLTVVYYYGVGVVPKGNCRQRKASLYTVEMQVNAVVVFAWFRR